MKKLPKHWEYNSLLTGHIPVSLACRCCNLISNCSWRLITSNLVAGVLDTCCTQSWLPSVHSLVDSFKKIYIMKGIYFWIEKLKI